MLTLIANTSGLLNRNHAETEALIDAGQSGGASLGSTERGACIDTTVT